MKKYSFYHVAFLIPSITIGILAIYSYQALAKSVRTGEFVTAMAVDPFNDKELYVGTKKGDVFKSDDGGETWTPINNGLKKKEILSIAVDPNNKKTIYCSTGCGAFKSVNGGVSWHVISGCGISDKEISAIVVDPTDASTFYAIARNCVWVMALFGNEAGEHRTASSMCDGLVRSDDKGKTCSFIGDFSDAGLKLECIAVDPTKRNTLYAGTRRGLYKSTDKGESFPSYDRRLDNSHITSIAIDPRDNRKIYATTTEGIFKSTDEGDNWSGITNNLPSTEVVSLVVDPIEPPKLYAGTRLGAFSSKDGGRTWQTVQGDLGRLAIKSLVIDLKKNALYAVTADGALKSTEDGELRAGIVWHH
ncbi:MAG: hypothetical protein CVU57_27410 [Deltaproteobacteria bacterium HGW-Deltaproteobacteria-15]|jgi:photosystem II stability/assembly factor-like uncharacterized protein|nr:MAG: hypothetical protein CVU57_27410 [Deltaproteobacteria bacterium HGW-Deltaproteobacteria-15]